MTSFIIFENSHNTTLKIINLSFFALFSLNMQKQSPEVFYKKNVLENSLKTYRKILVSGSLFE